MVIAGSHGLFLSDHLCSHCSNLGVGDHMARVLDVVKTFQHCSWYRHIRQDFKKCLDTFIMSGKTVHVQLVQHDHNT